MRNRNAGAKRRVFMDMDGVLCEYRPDAEIADMEQARFFRSLRPRTATDR